MIGLLILAMTAFQSEDVDFGAFHRKPIVKRESTSSSFPAQTLPKTIKDSLPKVKFMERDKFGKMWECEDKKILADHINNVNAKPFVLIDKFGISWESQDKTLLEDFIEGRNQLFDCLYGNNNS